MFRQLALEVEGFGGRAAAIVLQEVQKYLMRNGASPLPLPADLAVIAATRLGSEMLSSAVVLTGSPNQLPLRAGL